MNPALIRFWLNPRDPTTFCQSYLFSLLGAGIAPVRAISYAGGELAEGPLAERWQPVSHVFEREIADRFVNVVCAFPFDRTAAGSLALNGVTRVGVPNIAIFYPDHPIYEADEIGAWHLVEWRDGLVPEVVDALAQYDAVFAVNLSGMERLTAAGVKAPLAHVPPADVGTHLRTYVEELSR